MSKQYEAVNPSGGYFDKAGKTTEQPIPKMSDELAARSDVAAIEYGNENGRIIPAGTNNEHDTGADLTEAHEAGQSWMYRALQPLPPSPVGEAEEDERYRFKEGELTFLLSDFKKMDIAPEGFFPTFKEGYRLACTRFKTEMKEEIRPVLPWLKDLIEMAEDGYKASVRNGAAHQEFLADDRKILSDAKEYLRKVTEEAPPTPAPEVKEETSEQKTGKWIRMSQKFPEDWKEVEIREHTSLKPLHKDDIDEAEGDYFLTYSGDRLYYSDFEWRERQPTKQPAYVPDIHVGEIKRLKEQLDAEYKHGDELAEHWYNYMQALKDIAGGKPLPQLIAQQILEKYPQINWREHKALLKSLRGEIATLTQQRDGLRMALAELMGDVRSMPKELQQIVSHDMLRASEAIAKCSSPDPKQE